MAPALRPMVAEPWPLPLLEVSCCVVVVLVLGLGFRLLRRGYTGLLGGLISGSLLQSGSKSERSERVPEMVLQGPKRICRRRGWLVFLFSTSLDRRFSKDTRISSSIPLAPCYA